MRKLSIRLRLTLWYSVVLLAGLAIFGLGMWLVLEQRLIAGVDLAITQRVNGLSTVLQIEGAEGKNAPQLREELAEYAHEVTDGALIELRDSSGRLILPAEGRALFPPDFRADTAAFRTLDRDGRSYRVLTTRFTYGGETYDALAATDLSRVRDVIRTFRDMLLLMIPLVLLIAFFGGYWISGRALAPVDEITRQAKSISVQNLSSRLTVPNTADELQRMSETWNGVLERLETSVKRIRQFTADASHEIRTPVALIRATAELALRRERDPEEYRKWLGDIASEAERMTALTDSLLMLSRADSNGLEMPLDPSDLDEVVRDVVHQSEPAAEGKGLRIECSVNGRPAMARANAPAIRRLLLILIDNALKHTPEGGVVTVSAIGVGDKVTLAVKDTGEGIPANALPHIFERFYHAGADRSGAGLGLSIAQAIAQAHSTAIKVESSPGAGARFWLDLEKA